MNKHNIFYGNLSKSETLNPVTVTDYADLLIYESLSPFYGYYDDHPGKHNDNAYFYLVLDSHTSFVEVHRVTLASKAKLACKADMDHATLYVNHKKLTAIRVRYLSDFSQLAEVIASLEEAGVKFHKGKAKGEQQSITKITKYFDLKIKDDGIWIDTKAKHHAYIQIPQALDLDAFTKITTAVRNNWDGHSFDAGLGVLCTEDQVIEVVRIYSKHIQDKDYLTEMKRLFVATM